MAAGEDQPKPVVGYLARSDGLRGPVPEVGLDRLEDAQDLCLLGERPLAAQAVDRPVAPDAGDPRAWIRRDPVAGPALERDDERVLDRLLGAVEVPERAGQGGDGLARLAPEQAVEGSSREAQPSAAS
jgi:hypothetical protein